MDAARARVPSAGDEPAAAKRKLAELEGGEKK
jgi:hypothetical protein